MSLVCINVTKMFFCHVVFFPAVFSAGRQTCLVAWMSFTPLDRFAARLKKRLEKKLHDWKKIVLHLCELDTVVPVFSTPLDERPPAVNEHVINVPKIANVKVPQISAHLPNADADSNPLVIRICYKGQCKQIPRFRAIRASIACPNRARQSREFDSLRKNY